MDANMQLSEKRNKLRAELQKHGPAAIEMLVHNRPIEKDGLLLALVSASLLDEVTCGVSLKTLRAEVRNAADSSTVLNDFVKTNVDIQCQSWLTTLSGKAQSDALVRIVALAGISEFLSGDTKSNLAIQLEEAAADVLVNPKNYAALAQFAERLSDKLDLNDNHPAQILLAGFSEAELFLLPMPTQSEATTAVQTALSNIAKSKTGDQSMQPTNQTSESAELDLRAWAEKLKGQYLAFAEKLLGVADSPVLAADRGDRIQDFFESAYIDIPRVRTQMRFEQGRLLFVVTGDAGDLPEKATYGKRHIKCDSFTEHEDGDCEKVWELKNHQMKAIRLTWEDGESYDCVFE